MGTEQIHTSPWHRRDAGVTFLELVMVVAVLGVVGATTIPKFLQDDSGTEGLNYCQGLAQTLTGCLAIDIRNAQSYAMLRMPGYSIVPDDAKAYQYEIRDEKGVSITDRDFPSDVSITPLNISFDGLGKPSWSGDIILTKTMGEGQEDATFGIVHVEANTGAVWVVQQ